jgi:hypothetical protein
MADATPPATMRLFGANGSPYSVKAERFLFNARSEETARSSHQ